MDPLSLIAEQFGVFTTQDAYETGLDSRAITRAVRTRVWHRVRRGAFVPYPVWADGDRETRHLITAAAVHRSYGDRVAFSHVTAALIHGISVWGVDMGRVHVTRLDRGSGRTERDLIHHEGFPVANDDVVRVNGWLVTPPVRAALETGMITSTESSLVSLDSMLHGGLGSPTDLANLYDVVQFWPGTQHLQVAVRMADGASESHGESRCRWMFRCGGVPMPQLQYVVRNEEGEIVATTDFAWPRRRLLGEFDGFGKYGRLLKPGQTPSDAVFAEKVREDEARRLTRSGMVRFVWSDLDRPVRSCRRVFAGFEVAA